MKHALGHVLSELRYRKLATTQKEFGDKMGYTKVYISQVNNGTTPITDTLIDKIVATYGINRNFVITAQGDPFPSETVLHTNLKTIRQRWDITQEELGLLTGATRAMIMQYENPDRRTLPKADTLNKLAEITGIHADALIHNPLADADIADLSQELKRSIRNLRYADTMQQDNTPSVVAEETPTYNVSPKKPVRVFDPVTSAINYQYFDSILPTAKNKNQWIPYFNSIWNFIKQYNSTETISKDQTHNFWPMTPLPDDMLRMPGTIANFVIPAPADNNMYPAIKPNSPISVMFTEKDNINWGIAHLVVFNDRRYNCYYLKPGETDDEWTAISQNAEYDRRRIKVKNVMAVFEIIEVQNSRPGL